MHHINDGNKYVEKNKPLRGAKINDIDSETSIIHNPLPIHLSTVEILRPLD